MKKTSLTVVLTTLMAIFVFIGCHSTKEEKLEDAKENIDQAREDIQEATGDSAMTVSTTVKTSNATSDEWRTYRIDADARIERMNDRIVNLRIKIKRPGVALDAMRVRRIDELQERIARLKAQLADYKNDHGNWITFKTDLDKQLEEVSKSLDEASK